MEPETWVDLFVAIGIAKKTAVELARNKDKAQRLFNVVNEAKLTVDSKVDKKIGNMLYNLGVTLAPAADKHMPVLVKYILSGELDALRWPFAKDYVERIGAQDFDDKAFREEAGIGKTVSPSELEACIQRVLTEAKVLEEGWDTVGLKTTRMLSNIRNELKFIEGREVKTAVDAAIERLLGPKPAPGEKPKAKAKEKAVAKEEVREMIAFPDPRDNTANRPPLLAAHLARTGGRVQTRFPPEPNGFLHIGHAKAMSLDFGYAKAHGGITYMRFDDTNPEKEKQVYIDSILETLEWLGHKPHQITYSSDYFEQLYQFAVELIKKDKAYVCHQTAEEMKAGRMNRVDSPWRNRPIAESLQLFEDMRKGKVAEGSAALRVKGDMQNDNPNMRDLVAFRVKFNAHPHAGSAWCVYPSYDFSHCIVDSMEDITHSLCTLEFESRRQPYFWVLDELNLYKPVVWEFARLEFEGALLSKRKLKRLVEEGYVDGWDDPRLFTLVGLRRRGYTPAAIQSLCDAVGVTRVKSVHPQSLLEHHLRLDLDVKAERKFAVLEPILVHLTNLGSRVIHCEAPKNPRNPALGNRTMVLTNKLYIEGTDFRTEDAPGYFGLAPNKYVNLKYAGFIKATSFQTDATGRVTSIEATYEDEYKGEKEVKGHIHWVAFNPDGSQPLTIEARLYSALLPAQPSDPNRDWILDCRPDSKKVLNPCYAEASLAGVKAFDHFQFERIGYFCVDPDTTADRLVFNKSVPLNQAKELKK